LRYLGRFRVSLLLAAIPLPTGRQVQTLKQLLTAKWPSGGGTLKRCTTGASIGLKPNESTRDRKG